LWYAEEIRRRDAGATIAAFDRRLDAKEGTIHFRE
jgi:hypothetical protein